MLKRKQTIFYFTHFLQAVGGILFPRLCFYCEKKIQEGYLCKDCLQKINFLIPPLCILCAGELKNTSLKICGLCKKKKLSYDRLIPIVKYQEPIITLIHFFKYRYCAFLNEFFVSLIVKHLSTLNLLLTDYAYITYIPLHTCRKREREFNQSFLLAKSLSQIFSIPLGNFLLCKKNKPSQTNLSKQEREKNVRDAFCINPKPSLLLPNKRKRYLRQPVAIEELKGKNILIVDDIFTTGATVSACSSILKNLEINRIEVLVLAKA